MEHWEYCRLSTGWRAGIGSKKYIVYQEMLDGSASLETQTDIKIEDNVSAASHAISTVLCGLGAEGWELASLHFGMYGGHSIADAFLKRKTS